MKRKDVYSLADLFRQIELELIGSLRRTMARHKTLEVKEGETWEQWQKSALRDINRYRVDNRRILNPKASEVKETIQTVLNDTYENVTLDGLDYAKDLGVDISAEDDNFFKVNDKKLDALISEMKTDFDPMNGLIFRKMDNEYRNVLDKVAVKMVAGLHTYQSATDEATKELLSKGLNVIQYKDGRRVNVATYAEMYLRTANQRATFLAGGRIRDQLGVFTVLMSQHANCSKMCLPFQGTVLIDDVYTSLTKEQAVKLSRDTGYLRLSYAMEEYAFHPNCRHSISTWFPGKSSLPKSFTDKQKEDALLAYNEEQKQRRLENSIRRLKRIEKGSLDPKNAADVKSKVKELQSELRDHIKDNPDLRRSYWRERDIGGIPAVENVKTKSLPYEDVTQEWLDNIDYSKVGKVTERDYFEKDGIRYDSSNSIITKGLSQKANAMANWIADTLHVDVKSVPKVDKKAGSDFNSVSSPDLELVGKGYWDIKTPTSASKQVIYRNVRGKENQSSQFAFDLNYSPISLKEAIEFSKVIFERKDTQFVNNLLLKKANEFVILEKIKKR